MTIGRNSLTGAEDQLVQSVRSAITDWNLATRNERRQKIQAVIDIFSRLQGLSLNEGKKWFCLGLFWVLDSKVDRLWTVVSLLTDGENKFYREAEDVVNVWRDADEKRSAHFKSLIREARSRNCCVDEL